MHTHKAIPCCPFRVVYRLGHRRVSSTRSLVNKQCSHSRFLVDTVGEEHSTKTGTLLSFSAPQRYSQYPRKLGIITLSYGEGPKKLAHSLGISVEDAKVKIEDYFRPYPKVRQFIQDTHRSIREQHMVHTVTSRPRRFPDMETLGGMYRSEMTGRQRGELARAERQAVNSRIQGSAADVARRAMISCEFDQELKNLGVQMLLQIHDELVFEVPEESVNEALPIIKYKMEHPLPFDLSVPLGVDGGSGYSWSSAKG
ncbi:DNA-directed DNA polymerase, family A, palm domain containing protein [uncultured Caudovirales phage]|uniref:DNA-directed DNA polymerase, family A, palm domain containing protein n=1 Tax=uncultured Caudovirales phage TaxID=2100421 RepID=A0A6J5LJB3_9CAUD|nr:DNA-directed DNA polymerase, family A, palm domain containing protein [uncultured Caudovirales phage]CAB4135141.1 DNA-directed DNA polymerase, family A, palm domain containing protein [uncultured Caudovirales phage]